MNSGEGVQYSDAEDVQYNFIWICTYQSNNICTEHLRGEGFDSTVINRYKDWINIVYIMIVYGLIYACN